MASAVELSRACHTTGKLEGEASAAKKIRQQNRHCSLCHTLGSEVRTRRVNVSFWATVMPLSGMYGLSFSGTPHLPVLKFSSQTSKPPFPGGRKGGEIEK